MGGCLDFKYASKEVDQTKTGGGGVVWLEGQEENRGGGVFKYHLCPSALCQDGVPVPTNDPGRGGGTEVSVHNGTQWGQGRGRGGGLVPQQRPNPIPKPLS